MSNPNTIKTRFDAVATVGEYTNASGEKNAWAVTPGEKGKPLE